MVLGAYGRDVLNENGKEDNKLALMKNFFTPNSGVSYTFRSANRSKETSTSGRYPDKADRPPIDSLGSYASTPSEGTRIGSQSCVLPCPHPTQVRTKLEEK